MEYQKIIFKREDQIASIILNNPKVLNPLDITLADELLDALAECEKDDSVKAVVLSGAGKAFSAGGDIAYLAEEAKKPDFSIKPLATKVAQATLAIKKMSKPVICSVQGAAAGGGCNLALACDIVFAAENAKFIQAFVGIGLAPDTGGAFWLPRAIGSSRAFEMFISGRPVKADEAFQLGLVNKVFPLEELNEKTMEYAKKLASGPSVAYKNIKKMMFSSLYKDFEDFISVEVESQDECSKTKDFMEGITAFLEKRKPEFKGE